MAQSASLSQTIAGRYAQAVFDLAKESGDIDKLSSQVDDLRTAVEDSKDLRDLISSPVYSRDDQEKGISAIAKKMDLLPVLGNTLRLMAQNRRLFVLPDLAETLQGLVAAERGEMTADVISAVALSDAQAKKLSESLAKKSGKKIKLNTRVDDSLIGGMIVKLGSQMIDTSISSKLASLQNVMKEVG